jgi:hypothetical protein
MESIAQETLDDGSKPIWRGRRGICATPRPVRTFAFVFALVLIYFVLAAQFESFRDPLAILLTVPLALVGRGGLALDHRSDPEHLQPDRHDHADRSGHQERHPDRRVRQPTTGARTSPVAAACEAAVLRFRPVLMTSLSTILGCPAHRPGPGGGVGEPPVDGHRGRRRALMIGTAADPAGDPRRTPCSPAGSMCGVPSRPRPRTAGAQKRLESGQPRFRTIE